MALGQDDRAQRDLQLHAKRWPEHPRQGELLAQLAELHEAAMRHDQAARAWSRIQDLEDERASDGQRAHALIRQGRAQQAAGDDVAALRSWQAVIERWAGQPEGDEALRQSVAEALYRVGVETLAHYEAIDLAGHAAPTSRAAAQAWARRQVAAKAEALREVEKAHAAVIEAGAGSWGLTALVRLGGAYEHMADCLRGAWVPPWLTPEQAELYRIELDDEAWHQEEKAAEAYRAAVLRSREIAVYGEAVAEAGQRLTALRPEESPTPSEDLLEPGYLGTTSEGGEFEGGL